MCSTPLRDGWRALLLISPSERLIFTLQTRYARNRVVGCSTAEHGRVDGR